MSCGMGLSYKPRVINLEFASWGGRKERDSCDLGVKNCKELKIQTRDVLRYVPISAIRHPGAYRQEFRT